MQADGWRVTRRTIAGRQYRATFRRRSPSVTTSANSPMKKKGEARHRPRTRIRAHGSRSSHVCQSRSPTLIDEPSTPNASASGVAAPRLRASLSLLRADHERRTRATGSSPVGCNPARPSLVAKITGSPPPRSLDEVVVRAPGPPTSSAAASPAVMVGSGPDASHAHRPRRMKTPILGRPRPNPPSTSFAALARPAQARPVRPSCRLRPKRAQGDLSWLDPSWTHRTSDRRVCHREPPWSPVAPRTRGSRMRAYTRA